MSDEVNRPENPIDAPEESSPESQGDWSEAAEMIDSADSSYTTQDLAEPLEAYPAQGEESADSALRTTPAPVIDADADAEADLAKPSRAVQFRANRRIQMSMILPALLIMAFGGLLLYQNLVSPELRLSANVVFGLGVFGAGLALVARFLANGRRERGLFLVGTLILAWGGLIVAVITGSLLIQQAWPMAIMAIGGAFLLTFIFERSHERGLVFPALAFLVAGGIAVPIAAAPIAPDLGGTFGIFWPLILLVAVLMLLPGLTRHEAPPDLTDTDG